MGAVTPEPLPACYKMTGAEVRLHSRQKALSQNLVWHLSRLTGQRAPGRPRGQSADGTLTQSCQNAGPLSPPKQVAESASAEEGLGGGFSPPSSEVGLKGYHSNRWARPPLLCPSIKDGHLPNKARAAPGTWTGSRSARSPLRLLRPRHSTGSQCAPEHVCVRVGRDMGHFALEASPRPGPPGHSLELIPWK